VRKRQNAKDDATFGRIACQNATLLAYGGLAAFGVLAFYQFRLFGATNFISDYIKRLHIKPAIKKLNTVC
jgi:hypothetical protein